MNLYLRYLFPDFLLDASQGNMFARAAALRNNVQKRNYLLVYARRWGAVALLLCLPYYGAAALEWWWATLLFQVVVLGAVLVGWFMLVLWSLLLWESNQ